LTLRIDAVEVLGLAALGYMLGVWLKRRIPLLDKLNIPAPIAGGMVYALAILALRGRVNLDPDLALRDIFMVAFFTTVGLSVSIPLIRTGGVQVTWFLALASAGAMLQNALGIGLARLFGLDPLLGVISGSAALAGGPATTLAFGPTFEKLGVAGATTLGLASSTFGITAAGLLSGWIGGQLIVRHRLKPPPAPLRETVHEHAPDSPLLNHALAVAVAMGMGAVISAAIERTGIVLPAYIGAMIAAACIRALDDRFGIVKLAQPQVAAIGNISLCLFIVMALLGLRLWELASLALPMLVLLTAQVALGCALSVAVFRAMRRDYEAAVMASGYSGFMLGVTANALASMDELARKHGPAPRAFVVVPLVGGFLIDFTNALIITAAANLLR
jgi:ESS family glutamate:Na+ symporter